VFESLRRHGAKEALLVAWCIDSDGRKHLLHLAVGNKESEACWTEFFRTMLGRGLRMPTTITSDGAPGLVKAISVCFPASIRIRCWFHRLANIRAKLPDESAAEVMAHLYAVRDAPTLDAARAAADRLINTYRREYPAAVGCFEDDLDALLNVSSRPGAAPHPSQNHQPRRALLRRRTPPHQGHRPLRRRARGNEARLRHHDPRRRTLVPRLDQRPRTPPA
jgi:putative transposase